MDLARVRRTALGVGLLTSLGVSAFGEGPVVIHGIEFAEPPSAMSIETDDGW